MTDEHANHDGTDSENETDPTRHDRRSAPDDGDVSRRTFLQGAAASVVGAGALATAGDPAAAAGNRGQILVLGRAPGKHTYEIEMEQGGGIQKGNHAGSSDSKTTTSRGNQVVEGEVWNGSADTFTYSGEIDRVEVDGNVSFHFPTGAFVDDDQLVVSGEGSGTHDYVLGTDRGNLDPAASIGPEDTDHGPRRTERGTTPDEVSGHVLNDNDDAFAVGRGQPVQYVHLDGQLTVDPYRRGRSTTPDNGKEASVVFFYMGDGPFTTFFQNFIALNQAIRGYDRSILLKHDNQANGLSDRAHDNADVVRQPTRQNFEHCLRSLARAGYTIDLYIVSHGDRNSFKMSTGSFGSEDWYSIGDVEALRASFPGEFPLRLVYQTNCWGSELNDAWQRLGADAATGSRFVNFFPNQFQKFARNWRNGDTVERALRDSNTQASRHLVKQYLKADAGATEGEQWSQGPRICTQWAIWKGKSHCAKDYFVDRWRHSEAEWNAVNATGWQFVRYASEKQIGGNAQLTR